MQIRFWGVRGSIPVPGPATVAFGGNTSCVSVRLGDGPWVVFDAGTGLRGLGLHLEGLATDPGPLHLFLSHVHWDHIQGFPFFAPAFRRDRVLRVHGMGSHDRSLENILAGQMEGPSFPVALSQMGARIDFQPLVEGGILPIAGPDGEPAGAVGCRRLHHPDGALAYRLSELSTGASMVYATDHELAGSPFPGELLSLCRDAHTLVFDSTYTPEEYPAHRGWGHSSWRDGLGLARAAGVRRLVAFHHDPSHDDAFLEHEEATARAEAAREAPGLEIVFAREGMELLAEERS